MPETDDAVDVCTLIVNDEREVAGAYVLRLQDYCEVETVYDSEEALSVIRDSSVNIVLLNRYMPGLSGDDVLTEFNECDFSGRVVMATAISPRVEVLDMPFDDYLYESVDRKDARAVIDQQQWIFAYETLGEFFHVEAKRAVLGTELSPERRRERGGYDETATWARQLERRTWRLLPDNSILDQFDEIEREGV